MFEQAAESIVFFVNLFCWTFAKRDILTEPDVAGMVVNSKFNRRPFLTWPAQDAILIGMHTAELEGQSLALVKSRDEGASWLTTVKALHGFLTGRGANYLFVSRRQEEVSKGNNKPNTGDPKTLFWKIGYNLDKRRLPPWLLEHVKFSSFLIQNSKLLNTISGEPTTEAAGTGSRINQCYIDEAARIKELDAIEQSLDAATISQVHVSTVYDGSQFNRNVQQKRVQIFHLGWENNPYKAFDRYVDESTPLGINCSWYKAETLGTFTNKRMLARSVAENLNRQLGGTGRYLLPSQLIENYRADAEDMGWLEPIHTGELVFARDFDGDAPTINPYRLGEGDRRLMKKESAAIYFRDFDDLYGIERDGLPLEHPSLKLWVPLLSDPVTGQIRPDQDTNYAITVDPGAGVGRNPGAMRIWDLNRQAAVGTWSSAAYSPEDQGRIAVALAIWFGGLNPAIMCWETNGIGGAFGKKTVIDYLGWYAVFMRSTDDKLENLDSTKVGWFSNEEKKAELITMYGDMIANGEVKECDGDALDELKSMLRTEDGSVCSDLMAIEKKSDRMVHGDLAIATCQYALLCTETRLDGLSVEQRLQMIKAMEAEENPMTPAGIIRAIEDADAERAQARGRSEFIRGGWGSDLT